MGCSCAGEFTSSQHRDYSAVIAAIPIMALLALCLVAALVTAFGAAFRAAKHGGTPKTAGALVAAGGKGRVSRTPQNPIRILRFEHVSCSVPGSRFSADHWGIQGQQHAAIPLTNGHVRLSPRRTPFLYSCPEVACPKTLPGTLSG